MARKTEFKLGHVYIVDYDDHWSDERTYRLAEDGRPPRLRARGLLTHKTSETIVLEHSTHISDRGDKRSDRHGILRVAIRRVQHLGKER